MSSTVSEDPMRTRVATNVRMHRHARRLTLEELSERCTETAGLSISAAALLRVEQAKRGVEAGDLVSLALALGVGVPDLLAPSVDEGRADVAVSATSTVTQDAYLAVVGTPGHLAGAAAQAGTEAVIVPAEQMRAIASAFAAVGAAADEAARQFDLVTASGTSLHAIAAAAGSHARPAGRTSARLRQVGYTTEQLRDRFGPDARMGDAVSE